MTTALATKLFYLAATVAPVVDATPPLASLLNSISDAGIHKAALDQLLALLRSVSNVTLLRIAPFAHASNVWEHDAIVNTLFEAIDDKPFHDALQTMLRLAIHYTQGAGTETFKGAIQCVHSDKRDPTVITITLVNRALYAPFIQTSPNRTAWVVHEATQYPKGRSFFDLPRPSVCTSETQVLAAILGDVESRWKDWRARNAAAVQFSDFVAPSEEVYMGEIGYKVRENDQSTALVASLYALASVVRESVNRACAEHTTVPHGITCYELRQVNNVWKYYSKGHYIVQWVNVVYC